MLLGGSDLGLARPTAAWACETRRLALRLEDLDLRQLRLLHGDPLLLCLHRELREEDANLRRRVGHRWLGGAFGSTAGAPNPPGPAVTFGRGTVVVVTPPGTVEVAPGSPPGVDAGGGVVGGASVDVGSGWGSRVAALAVAAPVTSTEAANAARRLTGRSGVGGGQRHDAQ